MPSGFKVGGTDLDSLFAGRSSAPAAATGYKVGGTDLNDRYEPSRGYDQIASPTGYKVGGTDLKSIFRAAAYSVSASLTGPSDVYAGAYGSDTWYFSAASSAGLARVRFQVDGHGAADGGWTNLSGAPHGYGPFPATWADPFANPSISHAPDTYLFFFEAEDINGEVARQELYVTVH